MTYLCDRRWMLMILVVAVGCQTGAAEVDDSISGDQPEVEEMPEEMTEEVPEEISEDKSVVLPANFDVQGHRGARGLRPESTLPAFEVALDFMVNTIELDLHLSADDELIIWHDPFIEASLCSSEGHEDLPDPDELGAEDLGLLIRNLTAEQLSRYRCARNPDEGRFVDQNTEPTALAGDDFSIIRLSQLYDFVEEYANDSGKSDEQRGNARSIRFNIETKREPNSPQFIGDEFDGENPAMLEHQLVELIEERGYQERANIQSFDHRSLWAARTIAPWLIMAVLDREIDAYVELDTVFAEYRERGASIWSPRASLVERESIEAAHQAGLKVIPWTVNQPRAMERLIRLGVDGIITDRPDLLVEYR